MNGSWTNWKISPSPSEKNLPLAAQNLGSSETLLCNDSILCLDCYFIAFKFNILRNFTIKCFSFSYTLLKENKSLKEWVNSVGINPFMKYNIPVGFSFDNNILIITEKFTLIFWKTCRAISNQQKGSFQRALRAPQY